MLPTASHDIWINPAPSDPGSLRRAFGSFATGVTVVATMAEDGSPRAFTANSFSSVSLDPPLVLVCLGKFSASLDTFKQTDSFSISVLSASQREVSNAFASRNPDVKIKASEELIKDVAPYVGDSIATFLCSRHQIVDAGDHLVLIGRVQRYRMGDGQPLGFYSGHYVGLGPDLREIERLTPTVLVGGVLGYEGKILLMRRPGSTSWEIPWTYLPRGERQGRALEKIFETLGINARISVPYSVFQETGEHDLTVMFTVECQSEMKVGRRDDGTETALFGPGDEPWSLIQGEMKQSLVQRYLRELASGLYGVYFDTPNGGSVVALQGAPRPWSDWSADQMPGL